MIISIASGKGGTGKTTVAASLASVISESVYIDCDVEEPNGHLLLSPEFISEESAKKILPLINQDKCTFCGKCVEVCEFNALINLKFEIVLFDEMCHGCGACIYFCPSKVITERVKEIGVVRVGITHDKIFFADGLLNIGEVAAAPLIKEVKKKIVKGKINILDSPPGTSCSMVETVKDSDFCILVTESTPFGLNDLKLAIEVLKTINVPFGVVINKYDPTFEEMENFLREISIEVLLKIPFDRKYAESYSEGTLPLIKYPELKKNFIALHNRIIEILENVNAG
ncbi:MAG: nucleotide-binding protein [Candidatus Doudnabacteria bacterium]